MVEDSGREGKGAYCWFLSWAGPLHALLTVANVVSVANSNFQLATLVLIIGNILTMATLNKIVCWGHSQEEGWMMRRWPQKPLRTFLTL